MARTFILTMETYHSLYSKIINKRNLFLAWKKARKGKTKKDYVKEFKANLIKGKFLHTYFFNNKPQNNRYTYERGNMKSILLNREFILKRRVLKK